MKLIIQIFIYLSSIIFVFISVPAFSESKIPTRKFQYYLPGLKKNDNVSIEMYDSNYNKLAEEEVYVEKENEKMSVRKNDKSIEFLSRYDKNNFLLLTIGRVSNNNTWQISNAYLVPEKNFSDKSNFDGEKKILNSVYTDYVSPYHQLRAVNNIDGDNPNDEGYTGGWHAYYNSKGSPTSSMESFKLFIDDEPNEHNGIYQANKVKIETINLVQGINTKKIDGSGRPILQEKITYTIVDGKIDVEVNLKALEDITVEDYYFLQASTDNYNNGILPVGDNLYPFEIKNLSQDIYGGSKLDSDCAEITISDGLNDLIISIDSNYGIGDYKYNINDCRWFYRNYGKIYFNPISKTKNNPLYLKNNQTLKAKGFYLFKKK